MSATCLKPNKFILSSFYWGFLSLITLGCPPSHAQVYGPEYVNQEEQASIRKVARARAILVAYLCYMYEVDRGRFPISMADLYWPIDYVSGFSRIHGVDLKQANRDPLAGNTPFLIRPVVGEVPDWTCGFSFRDHYVRWWVVSRSGEGASCLANDVLFEDALPSHQSMLAEKFVENPDSALFYISDDEIRQLVTTEGFDLKEVVRIASLEKPMTSDVPADSDVPGDRTYSPEEAEETVQEQPPPAVP